MNIEIRKVKNGYLLNVECPQMFSPLNDWAPLYDTMLNKAAQIQEDKADPEMARIRRENSDEEQTSITEEIQKIQQVRAAENPSGVYIFSTYQEALKKAEEILSANS